MTNNTLLTLVLLLCTCFLTACNREADTTSPRLFKESGVSFSYPGNWEITEHESSDNFTFIAVEGNDALAIIHIYPQQEAASLDDFISVFSEETGKALPFGDLGGVTFSTVEKTLLSARLTGKQEQFYIKLFGQKVPHTREYFRFETDKKVLFVITHTADDLMKYSRPSFQLIHDSLVMSPLN